MSKSPCQQRRSARGDEPACRGPSLNIPLTWSVVVPPRCRGICGEIFSASPAGCASISPNLKKSKRFSPLLPPPLHPNTCALWLLHLPSPISVFLNCCRRDYISAMQQLADGSQFNTNLWRLLFLSAVCWINLVHLPWSETIFWHETDSWIVSDRADNLIYFFIFCAIINPIYICCIPLLSLLFYQRLCFSCFKWTIQCFHPSWWKKVVGPLMEQTGKKFTLTFLLCSGHQWPVFNF